MHLLDWYWSEIKGNLLAVPPCGIAVWFWLRSRHVGVKEIRMAIRGTELHAKLDSLLASMDPDTDGGLADVHAKLDDLIASVDPATPVGLTAWLHNLLKGAS